MQFAMFANLLGACTINFLKHDFVHVRGKSAKSSMAGSILPQAKKAKRSTTLTRVSAEKRAKQFEKDLCADGGVLFSRLLAQR